MCFAFSANFLSLVTMIPPAPQVMVLFPLKLNTPSKPKDPVILFLYDEPKYTFAELVEEMVKYDLENLK